jgi:O-antigen ligase
LLSQPALAYDQLFCAVVTLLAAAIPNDSVLGGYDPATGTGLRTPSFYIGIAATLLSIPLLSRILGVFARAKALLLMLLATMVAFVVLCVAVFLLDSGGFRPEYALDRPFKSFWMAVLFAYVAARPAWRRRLVLAYLAGWAFFVLVAVYVLATGQAAVSEHYESIRVSILGMNQNVQSLVAASGMVLLAAEALIQPQGWRTLVYLAGFMVGAAIFLVGGSRTGLVSLVAGLGTIGAVIAASKTRRRRLGKRLVALAVAVLVVSAFAVMKDAAVFDAVTSLETRIDAAVSGQDRGYRDVAFRLTMDVALDNPLGVGLGRTWDYLGMDPHNGYLKIWAEGGILAIVLVGAAYAFAAVNARRNLRNLHEIGVVATFVMFAISALGGQALVESPYWFFFAFIVFAHDPPRAALGVTSDASAAAVPRRIRQAERQSMAGVGLNSARHET